MKDKKYFAYDDEDGFQVFETAPTAKEEADRILAVYRDDATAYGWNESAETVCWGEIKGKAEMRPTGEKCFFEGEYADGYDCKLE